MDEITCRTAMDRTQTEQTCGHGESKEGESGMDGESNMETYTIVCKVDSQWEFAVWLRELKWGLCNSLEGVGWGGRFRREGTKVGKDWRQKEKGMTEDEMVGWHPWLDGHEFFFVCLFFLNWRLITLQNCGGFCHPWISHGCTCDPHPELPSHLPPHPIPQGHPKCTSPEHPVSCIEPGLAICFTCDNIHVSMLISQIIPPSPSPTESKYLFFTSVCLLLSRIQGHCYHLSKFHIYALIYCIGVFLSDLLCSV